jgi:hypothetical protein
LFPRALAPRRLPLTFASGEFFKRFLWHVQEYIYIFFFCFVWNKFEV